MDDLCADPDRYNGQNIAIRGQVIQIDYFSTENNEPYTQVQIGAIYVPSSPCLTNIQITPIVIFFDGTISQIEQGIVVFVRGTGNGTVTGPGPSGKDITAPWIIGDNIEPDRSCNIQLIVHADDPRMYISLDRLRSRSAVTGARFDNVCSGSHTLSGEANFTFGGEVSITIPDGVSVWEVQYGTGSSPDGGGCFNCP